MIAGGLATVLLLADGTSTFAARSKTRKHVVSLVNTSRAKSKASKRVRSLHPAAYIGRLRRLNGYPHHVSAVGRRRNAVVIPTNVRRVSSRKLAARPRTVVVDTSPAESTVLPIEVTDNNSNAVSGRVLKVVEGQTVLVDTGIKLIKVRLLGVDLMAVDGSRTDFKEAARQHLAKLIEDQRVLLSFDDTAAKQDEDGVTVAYLRRQSDSVLINRRMIRDGYALAATDYNYQIFDVLVNEQQQAQEAKAGIWAYVESAGS